MQPPSKRIWQSRTIWANVVAIVIIILVQLKDVPGLDPALVPYLVAAIPIANMILRLITTQPLALTAGPITPTPYMAVPSQAPEGVSFDTRPAAPPADLPTLPGKEGPHDGQ